MTGSDTPSGGHGPTDLEIVQQVRRWLDSKEAEIENRYLKRVCWLAEQQIKGRTVKALSAPSEMKPMKCVTCGLYHGSHTHEEWETRFAPSATLTPGEAQKALKAIIEKLKNDEEKDGGEAWCYSTSDENLLRIAIQSFQLGMKNK